MCFVIPYVAIVRSLVCAIPCWKDLREDLNSNHRYLTELLYKSDYMVEYNEFEFQKKSPLINTCGRWTINRLRYPEISIDEYHKLFKDASKKMPMDELIVQLVPI